MGGHRDSAEKSNAPLFSFSLGCEAINIFLISENDDQQPLPLHLRSGDCLIMSGKSRFALHAVVNCNGGMLHLSDALHFSRGGGNEYFEI